MVAAMSAWQPIETAPKDADVWIIAWDGNTVLPVMWINDTEFSPYTGWAYASETWGGVLYDGYNEVVTTLTHWMPLPAPPEAP